MSYGPPGEQQPGNADELRGPTVLRMILGSQIGRRTAPAEEIDHYLEVMNDLSTEALTPDRTTQFIAEITREI
jgi:hypothetical protein